MVYKCARCGKEFETGAVFINGRVYCQDCADLVDDIINDYVASYMEAKLFGNDPPDLTEYLNSRAEEIESLKLKQSWFRLQILTRILNQTGGAP